MHTFIEDKIHKMYSMLLLIKVLQSQCLKGSTLTAFLGAQLAGGVGVLPWDCDKAFGTG